MTRTKTLLIAALAVAWPAAARADQCAVVDRATAARAIDELFRHAEIISYCEPCGDAAPGLPTHAARAMTRHVEGGVEVVIDGRPVDLAYTYVQTSSHRYENLAALVACPTTGVSPSLAVDDATPTGVLIHADTTPVRQAEELARPSLPAVYIVAPTSHPGVGWDVIAGACLITSAVWWLGASRLRRRRAMRPRATEL
jgi:hypothetical protein